MNCKAIFLDRDGVLIKDKHLISSMEQVELLPDVPEAMMVLRKLGYKLFLITNQAVVARGILTLEQTLKLNQDILDAILRENAEAICEETFLCPHHPKATLLEYRLDCDCRKPKAGMILLAQKKYQLDLTCSFVIGDRLTDIYAGKSAGCNTIQLITGEHDSPLIESTLTLKPEFLKPDYQFNSLMKAAQFLKDQL